MIGLAAGQQALALEHGTASGPRGRMSMLDGLRFAAAFAVLLYHYVSSYPLRIDGLQTEALATAARVTRYGYLGVHVFFMISGFVILWSSTGRSAMEFAVGRFVRLYPSFWASVGLASGLLWCLGTSAEMSVLSWKTLAANGTMLPTLFGSPRIDDVYWTLEVELRFYGLVFLLLAARQMHRVETWIAAWTVLMACELVVGGRLLGLLTLAPYGPLFAVGSQCFIIRRDGSTPRRRAILAAAGGMGLYQASVGRHEFVTPDPISAVVAPAIVAFGIGLLWAASAVDRQNEAPFRLATLLGELTYPLYLTHATLGMLVLRAFPSNVSAVVRLMLTTLLALAVAMLFTRLEAPVRRYLTRQLRPTAAERLVGSVSAS